jgi:hypothetical protein
MIVLTTAILVTTAILRSVRGPAVGRPAAELARGGETGDGCQTKTSTVPKLRDVHRRALVPNGLLQWKPPVIPNKMLNLIKVLRLTEALMA